MITCRLLGPVEIQVNGAAPPPELLWRKNLGLLVYLACSPRGKRSREHLAALLWTDSEKARHSLNQALATLRRLLGEAALDGDSVQVSLHPGQLRTDIEEFAAHEAAGAWERAAALAEGEFLEGFSVPESSAFDDWLATERSAWRERLVRALARTAAAARERGDLDVALRHAQRACAMDPGSESALGELMQALALGGDRAGALQRWEGFRARLEEQFGAAPGADLTRLAERVRRERVWRHAEGAARDAARRRAPLVGRGRELEALLGGWRAGLARRAASLLVLTGDSGTGKTRLLEEVAARIRLEGASIAAMRAVEGDVRQPGSALLALARNGVLEFPGIAGASAEALAGLAAVIPEWRDRFPATVPTPLAPAAALTEVLRRAAEEAPIVLVVDDAQWADGASLEAIGGLLRDLAGQPLTVLVSSSDQPRRPELDTLRSRVPRDLPGVTITLGPLAEEAIPQLARWALPSFGPEELERLARRIAADSAGLPLLAVELLHAVANGLDLSRVEGAWPAPYRTLTETLPGGLPDAVLAAVRVGFRRLSPAAQRVLQASAVLSERETRDRLGLGAGLDGEDLDRALDELEWTRWLVADARGYSFLARIIRDIVAQDLLTPGQRNRIRDLAGEVSV